MPTNILVYGDSITYGAWDLEKGGWVQRLRSFVEEKNELADMVYNLGVSGDTTTDLLVRFGNETRQRIDPNEDLIIIFFIGNNDSVTLREENKQTTEPDDFATNLQALFEQAKQFTDKIVFCGLTPVDDLKVAPVIWNTNVSYNNKKIYQYNEMIKKFCKENDLGFIDLFEKFNFTNYQELLEDGLHPNAQGHEMIFQSVKDYLVNNKII